MSLDFSEVMRGALTTVAAASLIGVGTVAIKTNDKVTTHELKIEQIDKEQSGTSDDIREINRSLAQIKTDVAVLVERTKEQAP